MSILKDDWDLNSLEWRVGERSYVVSGLYIRDVVFRLSADWMVII